MASWSTRRKISYLTVIGAFMLFAIALPLSIYLYKPPSCTDGKQNQNEFGVDCGGPCSVLCRNQSQNLIVRWQRALPVTEGVYNVVAYVENPNLSSGVDSIGYHIKLYDERSILLAERVGSTVIPANKHTPIFEAGIATGERIPRRVTFTFDSEPVWKAYTQKEPELRVTDQVLTDAETLPLIRATVSNRTYTALEDIDVVVVVYDENDNAQAASKTVIDALDQNASAQVYFSWPQPFAFTPARIEIVPILYPGRNY